MPQVMMSSGELIQAVYRIATEEATRQGARVMPSGMNVLTDAPPAYLFEGRLSIDTDALEQAVSYIVSTASTFGPVLEAYQIRRAISQGVCHYLWFC
jgi:hypothetical protein